MENFWRWKIFSNLIAALSVQNLILIHLYPDLSVIYYHSGVFWYINYNFDINNVISCLFNFYLIPKIPSYRKKY